MLRWRRRKDAVKDWHALLAQKKYMYIYIYLSAIPDQTLSLLVRAPLNTDSVEQKWPHSPHAEAAISITVLLSEPSALHDSIVPLKNDPDELCKASS